MLPLNGTMCMFSKNRYNFILGCLIIRRNYCMHIFSLVFSSPCGGEMFTHCQSHRVPVICGVGQSLVCLSLSFRALNLHYSSLHSESLSAMITLAAKAHPFITILHSKHSLRTNSSQYYRLQCPDKWILNHYSSGVCVFCSLCISKAV